jgi:hypothetical protein
VNKTGFIDKLNRALDAEEHMKVTLAHLAGIELEEILTDSSELEYFRGRIRTIEQESVQHIKVVSEMISDISNGTSL